MKQNNIVQLIQNTEVEWKTLGEILIRTRGIKITAGEMKTLHKDNGAVKIFAGGKTFALINYDDIHQKDINIKPSIIVKSRGIIEFEYYDKPFSHKNEMWAYHSQNKEVDIKFIYYFLKQNELFFQNIGAKMQMPQISIPDTDKFLIPIPPLPIQQEIVKTLDKLTELEAELSLREKQYNYYRDQLLTFGDDVEWKTLGEVAIKISSGGTPKTEIAGYYNGYIPWLRTQEVGSGEIWDTAIKITDEGLKNSSAKMIPENCVIVAMYGATVGKVGINKIPLSTNQACANIQLNEDVVRYRYVYYFLLSQYEYIKSLGTGSQTNINAHIVKIPVPPLSTQEKIVGILDKFDTLTKSITEGLPKEIELRRKQYEYYRELLLSFPKPKTK